MAISNAYDDYWKLPTYGEKNSSQLCERLKARGFLLQKKTTKSELLAMLHRYERGERCYEMLTNLELRNLRLGRHHLYTERDQTTRNGRLNLIRTLRANDTTGRSFRRFTDLPPELRGRVYDYYIASFHSTLETPAQPPLARTCKLLRQEVLPHFYRSMEFEIGLKRSLATPGRIYEDNKTLLFLTHLVPEDLACIQKLKVSIRYFASFAFNLSPEGSNGKFTCNVHRNGLDRFATSLQVRMLVFIEALPTMAAGRKYFRLQDVYKIRGIVEKAIRDA